MSIAKEPGTIEGGRLLELDLSLNPIVEVPQLQNLPALEWLSLQVLLHHGQWEKNVCKKHERRLKHLLTGLQSEAALPMSVLLTSQVTRNFYPPRSLL